MGLYKFHEARKRNICRWPLNLVPSSTSLAMLVVQPSSQTTGVKALTFLLFFAIHVASVARADAGGSQVFDVTQFGAETSKNDNSEAFLAAWEGACSFEGSASFLVPDAEGAFVLGPIELKGPCHNGKSPAVEIHGTVKALPDIDDFPDDFWIQFCDLHELMVSGHGVLDGDGANAWSRNQCDNNPSCEVPPTTLKFVKVGNSSVDGIHLLDSKGFHMNFHECDHIDVHDLTITAPGGSPNTDGIHMGNADHISVADSIIGTGDDCVSIGPGTTNVNLTNVTCGPGHGISVGSLGKYQDEEDVRGLYVKNCTIMDTTNGIRIKTWPGSSPSQASNFTFEDITMVNVSNPIIIDQQYCAGSDDCPTKPSQVEIRDIKFRRIEGTSRSKVAVNLVCSKDVPCQNIELDDIKLSCLHDNCNTTASCENVNGTFSGEQLPGKCELG